MRSPERFLNIVDNPHFLDRSEDLTSLERLELGVLIFLNVAMFVVKLTDLIPENKSVNGRFLQN